MVIRICAVASTAQTHHDGGTIMRRRERCGVASLAFALTATGALLLSGCAGSSTPHAGATSGHPSAHPSSTAAATSSPRPSTATDDDIDDDAVDDKEGPDDADDDDDDDGDDELKALGIDRKHLDSIEDPEDRDDFINDAREAAHPANASLQCVAVHPTLDDEIAAAFGGIGVDEIAAARASTTGYFLAVDLEDGRIAVLYAPSSPMNPDFDGVLYAVDDLARSLSTYLGVDIAAVDVSGDDGISRAPRCL